MGEKCFEAVTVVVVVIGGGGEREGLAPFPLSVLDASSRSI